MWSFQEIKSSLARFLRYTGILYGLSLLLQLPLHNVIWPVRTCWQAVCGSVFLCLATRLWQSRRWYVALVLVTLLSVAAGYIPWWDRHVVSGSAVVSALVTGLSYFCAYSILRAVLHRRVRTPWGRRAGEVALFLGYTILGLLPPLVVLGYYGLSGHFFQWKSSWPFSRQPLGKPGNMRGPQVSLAGCFWPVLPSPCRQDCIF